LIRKKYFVLLNWHSKKVQPKDSTFTLAFGDSIYEYSGKISLIDRAVDPQTGTIKMRVEFPNPRKN
jgi:membrane fusion protein (multidrug efflux system)